MKIRTSVKVGGRGTVVNHNQTRKVVIRTGVKAGALSAGNHNQTRKLAIRTGVKAGGWTGGNHNAVRA